MRKPSVWLNKATFKLAAVLSLIAVSAIINTGINAQKLITVKKSAAVIQQAERATAETKIPETAAAVNAEAPTGGADAVSAAGYPFTNLTGIALEDMSSGTTQLLAAGSDDVASSVTNIGFDFWFDGARQSQFSVNSNGLMKFNATVVTTTAANSMGTVTNAPKLTAYWDDLCVGTTGKVHYKVVGSAPNRKLIVEWQNMVQYNLTLNTCSAAAPVGTYQIWLYESAGTTSPGLVEFVYNTIGTNINTNTGYSVGMQSGAATNFAAITTTTNTVAYGTANDTQVSGIPAGTAYLFTPTTPAAPTGLTFTGTTAIATTLNWTDNSSNELGFAVYRSNDGGATYNFVGQAAANATSFTDTALAPSTNYLYRVYAVTEGVLSSPALAGSQTTSAPGAVSCVGAGGLWSAPATWSGGAVPTATDNVTIISGCTVTIDTASAALNLSVQNGGILQYENTTARTLTVSAAVTINSGGTFQSAAAGTVTTHVLSVGTDLTNNGTLDFSTNANTAGAGITFTGAANNTFGGTGAVTDVRAITINKGTTAASILELNPTNFTVQGVTTDSAGFLTLTSGTFKISGTFTVANRVFTATAYTFTNAAGIWLNNPNFTVAGQGASPTPAGLLRLTQGTYNVGTASGNSLTPGAGAVITIEGGTMNVAGRLQTTSVITYNQSGGTVNICTVGNAAATGSFGLTGANTLNMTGGTIVLVQRSTAATPIDYLVSSSIIGPIGTTLQIGSAATATNFAFNIRGSIPNLVIDNTGNNKSAVATAQINLQGTTLIKPGTTLTINGFVCLVIGPTFTNNGTLTGTAASTRFYFLGGSGPTTYTGTGTVTAPLLSFEVDNVAGVTLDPSINQIVTSRVNNFSGGITNANKLTIGNGGATTATVQVGVTGATQTVGGLDVAPVFNPGTGGINLFYAPELTGRTTGPEMPPSRTLNALNITNTNPITIAGGDVTVNGTAAGVLALSGGRVITGTNTLIFNSATGTVTRTTGYVDGNFNKVYAAIGSKTFEVGTLSGYSPATANVTAGTFPSSLTVKAVQQVLPGLNSSASITRYWTLTEIGDLTADLTFTYLDADINGDENTYSVFRRELGVTAAVPGSSNNAATNTASAPAISVFSDWGVGAALGPTAAQITIEGRALQANGKAISGARLTITDSHGVSRSVVTNTFGNYRFENIDAGSTYVIGVSAKGYTFRQPVQALTVNESLTGVNFTALAKSGTD